MKVLLINNFHYRKGGSETVYFNTGKMLEEAGDHTDWKSRALLAEAKLAALKEAMSGILSRF